MGGDVGASCASGQVFGINDRELDAILVKVETPDRAWSGPPPQAGVAGAKRAWKLPPAGRAGGPSAPPGGPAPCP
jgi:hypothetical protein